MMDPVADDQILETSSPTASLRIRPPRPLDLSTLSSQSSSSLKSPSYWDISNAKTVQSPISMSPRSRVLSRSKTLPQIAQGHRRQSTDGSVVVMEQEKLARMRRWIHGFAIVNFDLDKGPVIQGVHPSFWISQEEEENIAFSSFPDSLQFEQGFEAHSFRIRDYGNTQDSDRKPSLDGFVYGYSHFSQKRDPSSKRGYSQRSVVILTHHQYPALFSTVASRLGPLFHAHGVPMLETACHNIANWCDPTPGTTVELGFLGSVLHVELPLTPDEQQLTETSSFHEKFDPAMHILASSAAFAPPPIQLFEASLSHLWSIWECLVFCEPILVFGPSPAMTSQATWWLRDLLRPIPLAIDIRPYFTIHDKDHSLLVNKFAPKAGLLLGVTNPFFEKTCTHWPHVLSLGRHTHSSSPKVDPTSTAFAGPRPGWKTKTHKRYTSKDRVLLKQLEDACAGSGRAKMEASLQLRRHFSSRSNALLVPLNRYLNTLIPPPAGSPPAKAARMKSFNATDFFASLKQNGSPLPFRSASKQKEFYQRWLRTPVFGLWLARQEEIIQNVLLQRGAKS